MNSILVVDDEALIRQGIISRIDYLGLNPHAVYQASNGEEALEILAACHPLIVMTDINMPVMDGLTLIKTAKQRYPDVCFIILTVFADFDYAKEAMALGVSDYVLKPISNNSLTQALTRVLQHIEERHSIDNAMKEISTLRQSYNKISEAQLFTKLLHMSSMDEDELRRAHRELFPGRCTCFQLAVLHLEYPKNLPVLSEKDLLKHFEGIIEKSASPLSCFFYPNYNVSNQIYLVLAASEAKIIQANANSLFGALLYSASDNLNATLTMGVSEMAPMISKTLLAQANEACRLRLINGPNNFYLYTQIEDLKIHPLPQKELDLLVKHIEHRTLKNISASLKNIFNNDSFKTGNPNYLRLVWTKVVNNLITSSASHWKSLPGPLKESILTALNVDIFDTFHSKEEMVDYLYKLIVNIFTLDTMDTIGSMDRIQLAIDYLNRHYAEEIAINDLASQYNLSPNYFSTAFKKETGTSVINYITDLRIKEACRLLSDTQVKVIDVSSRVGYTDSQYFFRVFKKYTGKTPLQYRAENGG